MKPLRQSLNQNGLTLIEVIIALAVITTGVISGLTLTSYNLTSVFVSETRLIAANLAREGIEVIRQKRDANWLLGNPWNSGIVEAGKYRLTVNFDSASNQWTTVSQAVDINNCSACQLYLDEANGVYSHNFLGSQTSYKRLITIREICWQDILEAEVILAEGEECAGQNQLVGWQAESKVSWLELGNNQEINVIDRLYDWR